MSIIYLGRKLVVGIIFMLPFTVQSELYFAPELIASDPKMVADLSRFEKTGEQLPGIYQVDIYVNGTQMATREILFIDAKKHDGLDMVGDTQTSKGTHIRDSTGLMACLNLQDFEDIGINVDSNPEIKKEAANNQCLSPGKYFDEAFESFDFQRMQLNISIPQASMRSIARGFIAPERWDDGINAALLNYKFNGSTRKGVYGNSSSHYLNLESGLNLGPWRIRDSRTWNEFSGPYSSHRQWQHLNTYAGRAIAPLRSELIIGDSTTSGDIFDSLGFRGFQLSTDDAMFPDSQRGFAPVIRGVANTNARVSIRQNGYTVYQMFVAPGAFEIDDLYSVGSSGDLEVTVTEADGTAKVFRVPFSSLPTLQRKGRINYSFTAGQYRPFNDSYNSPDFVQGTMVLGLPLDITVFNGMQYSTNYLSGLLGVGLNLGALGAFSADITHAKSKLIDGVHHQGHSLRLLYARTLNSLGTTIQLTGYRYSSEGFHTLDETALKKMKGWVHESDTVMPDGKAPEHRVTSYYNLYDRRRSKIQATLSQRVGEQGSIYMTGVRQTFHNKTDTSDSLQAGFISVLGSINYSLNYSYSTYSSRAASDTSVLLSLSVPLNALFKSNKNQRNIYATYNASRGSSGESSHQAGISGTALKDNNLNWNVSQGVQSREGNNGNLGFDYRGTYGSNSLGYSYSNDFRQLSYGLSGGAVVHANGLTLGQSLGETSILVAAPGLSDVALENETGVRTDWRGYAIKPHASVYRENRVALDITSMDDQTEIDGAVSHSVPTRRAVVKAVFKGSKGNRVLMTLTHNGKYLPFGTSVTSDDRVGIVGDDGQVYLSGLPETGSLIADWGNGRKCITHYQLPSIESQSVLRAQFACN